MSGAIVSSSKRKPPGFSLIEIVIALGVISFAIVGIMGLLPAAMKSAQESQRETRATFIAHQIMSDLASMPPTSTFVATNSDVLTARKMLSLRTNSQTVVDFDEEGSAIQINGSAKRYRVTVAISTNNVPVGLTHVQVSVLPLTVASNATAPYVFATMIDN